MEACPFGAMQFDDERETAVKCDLCVERLNNEQSPACCAVCPTRCISWGETKVLADRVAREALPQKMK
jgi:Fe-S-cluster-containing dehydrogenase component